MEIERETIPTAPRPDQGIFYGWWIGLAGTLILTISSGLGFYGHGVVLDPLCQAHGWSKGSVSSAVTLYFFTAGISGMIVGRRIDRFGPRRLLVLGSLMVGSALALLGHITALWQLYAVYLLMAVGWSATSLIPVSALLVNWFILKRGRVMSLVTCGLSIGGIVMVPLATFLIARWGLNLALPLLGAIYCAGIIPPALLVVKQKPSDVGQFPDGLPPQRRPADKTAGFLRYDRQMKIWTRAQALRTISFWAIVTSFFLAMICQVAYLVHQISFLSQSLGLAGAASAVSLTAAASIAGRLILGVFIDRLDKRHVTMGLFILQAAAILALALSNHNVVLYLGTFIFGLTMGSIIMTQSLITAECFGMISFGTVSGLAGMFVAAGSAIGPSIAGVIFDATRSYHVAFTLFAAVSLLAAAAILFAKPPATPPQQAKSTP
ncbi:MAG: MFS transporter [Desulfobacteraceae bacterium]|nr:MAG: MFS transporter [Desulfobacteraceae bacterium]